jgi:phosphoribosyl 1,2-cyclic phosphodiesterase
MKDYIKAGIEVYSSDQCFDAMGINSHRAHPMMEQKVYNIGSFKVMPFELVHDVYNLGFLIDHPESGKFPYITDTHYCPYTFKNLSNIIIECNYAIDIVDNHLLEGEGNVYIRNRVLGSHMELQTTKDFLKANDLTGVLSIVLTHLSNENSDAKRFKKEIEELTGKMVYIADPGLEIAFNETPF